MLVRPTGGKVEIDGQEVTGLTTKQLVPVRRKAR